MYIKLTNGIVYDPVHGINGEHQGHLYQRRPYNPQALRQYEDM